MSEILICVAGGGGGGGGGGDVVSSVPPVQPDSIAAIRLSLNMAEMSGATLAINFGPAITLISRIRADYTVVGIRIVS